jgi:hypothetical protein
MENLSITTQFLCSFFGTTNLIFFNCIVAHFCRRDRCHHATSYFNNSEHSHALASMQIHIQALYLSLESPLACRKSQHPGCAASIFGLLIHTEGTFLSVCLLQKLASSSTIDFLNLKKVDRLSFANYHENMSLHKALVYNIHGW